MWFPWYWSWQLRMLLLHSKFQINFSGVCFWRTINSTQQSREICPPSFFSDEPWPMELFVALSNAWTKVDINPWFLIPLHIIQCLGATSHYHSQFPFCTCTIDIYLHLFNLRKKLKFLCLHIALKFEKFLSF